MNKLILLTSVAILCLGNISESLAVQSWDCSPIPGTNTCTATFEGNTLTISGSGAMKDYASYNSTPWFSIRESITSIIVEGADEEKGTSGITSIGKYSLCNTSLTSLNLSSTVSSIGEYAFGWTRGNNKELDLSGIKTLGEYAFYGSSNILSVDLSNATSIGDNAFSGIQSLGYAKLNQQTLANIPSGVFSATKIAFCSYNKDPIRCNMCTGGVNIGSPNSNTPVYKEGNCVAVGDCGEGYVQNGNICKKLPGCGTFENGKCTTCTQGYLTNFEGTCTPVADCKNGLHQTADGACTTNDDENCNTQEGDKCTECKVGYLEQGGSCVASCSAGYKQFENWCNKIQWTPAEAAKVLRNDNTNEVTITFKK